MQGSDQLHTRHVFIDTSIFVAANFHYETSTFKQLRTLAREEYLHIYLTPITIREVKANIHDRVQSAHRAVQKCKREAMVLRHLPHNPYEALFTDLDTGTVADALIKKFEDFITDTRTTTILLNGIPVDQIFERYFSASPPFGTGKKKSEFPDAFVLSALSEWCVNRNEKIYVISPDGDMARACEEHQSLISLDSLEALLNLVATDDKIMGDFAESAFKNLQPDIIKGITDKFKSLGFIIDDEEGEVESVEANDVNIDDYYLIYVTDRNAEFRIEVILDYSADVTYYDPDSGIYDREEDEVLFRETIDETLKRTVHLGIDLRISFPGIGDAWLARLDSVRFDNWDIYVSVHDKAVRK
ncbi:MAG TPA: PIN domain-containing protein [Pyrinomonadaceae bacterium]|nr:PIN domain-containing protein [Pyrinomonadaceae bacterium]